MDQECIANNCELEVMENKKMLQRTGQAEREEY